MTGSLGQRVLVGAVVVLAFVALFQAGTIRNLRADLAQARSEAGGLRAEIAIQAQKLAASTLEKRRQEIIQAGEWLQKFYQSDEGLKRPEGLWIAGHPDFEGIGAWLLDVYLRERLLGASDAAARQKVGDGIRQSDEWRSKHPRQ